MGQTAPQAGEAYNQFLSPSSLGDYQDLFQQAYINPAVTALQRNIIPEIQQSFVNADAGSSSALNQALSQAATDVATNLGGQFGNFFQQQQANKLGALGQLGGLSGQRTFEPMIEQTQGILAPIVSALGSIYAGGLAGGKSANPFDWFNKNTSSQASNPNPYNQFNSGMNQGTTIFSKGF